MVKSQQTQHIFLAAAVITVALLGGGGCASSGRVDTGSPPSATVTGAQFTQGDHEFVVCAAADVSGSMDDGERKRYAGILEQLADDLGGRAYWRCWRFAANPQMLWEGMPDEAEDLWNAVDTQIMNPGPGSRDTTLFVPSLQYAEQAAKMTGKPVVVLLLTDGDFKDPVADVQAASRSLVAVPNLKLVFAAPVMSDLGIRTRLEQVFSPIREAGKLVVGGPTDTPEAIEEVLDRCQK